MGTIKKNKNYFISLLISYLFIQFICVFIITHFNIDRNLILIINCVLMILISILVYKLFYIK